MRIEKKVWPAYFDKIANEEKNFEVRLADWSCTPGDVLVLREWDPKTKSYTGRVIEKTVSFVMRTKDFKIFSQEDISKYGLQIIGLK